MKYKETRDYLFYFYFYNMIKLYINIINNYIFFILLIINMYLDLLIFKVEMSK